MKNGHSTVRSNGGDQRRNLELWVIYLWPRDFPDKVVARKWRAGAGGTVGTDDIRKFETLAWADDFFRSRGLTFIAAEPGDDPVIVGSWM